MLLEEDQADARLEQQYEDIDPRTRSCDTTTQTCHPHAFRYVEKNVRHERFGQEVWSNIWMSRMCHDWQSSLSQLLGHMQGQDARRTGEE